MIPLNEQIKSEITKTVNREELIEAVKSHIENYRKEWEEGKEKELKKENLSNFYRLHSASLTKPFTYWLLNRDFSFSEERLMQLAKLKTKYRFYSPQRPLPEEIELLEDKEKILFERLRQREQVWPARPYAFSRSLSFNIMLDEFSKVIEFERKIQGLEELLTTLEDNSEDSLNLCHGSTLFYIWQEYAYQNKE